MRHGRIKLNRHGVVLLGGFFALLPGCALSPLNSFLDPTKVGQFPLKYSEGGIRRVLTPREAPPGLANAVEPTPEDLVPVYEEYRISLSDEVAVIIMDFSGAGQHEQIALSVTPLGYIRLPQLGSIKVVGMTEQELEEELKARLIDAGILPVPIVRVIVQTPRQRFFSILGAANVQSVFAIAQPDLRLLDALAMARGIGPNVKTLYVIRREEPGPPEPLVEPATETPEPQEPELIIPPPEEADEESSDPSVDFFGGLTFGAQDTGASDPQRSELEELETAIAPPGQVSSQPAIEQEQPELERAFPPIIFDPVTGEPKLVEPERPSEREEPSEPLPELPEFDWEAVPEYELSQRVIEIDVKALQAGDPRYNIVLHDRDTIQIPVDTGIYYMMGEVNRPGVYAFGDREITIKQALAASGGFSPLAWPARCEIIRREPGTDTQITIPVNLDAVFAGLADDILLRDDDILNVGTHFVAPFLFVARNSFRFTYGFGFVYDRNFADKDSYSVKINPQTLKIQEQQRRGLPF